MPALSPNQTAILRELFSAVPDAAVGDLERALADTSGAAMAQVQSLVAAEAGDRRTRAMVFGPLMALCRPVVGSSLRFPAKTPMALWNALRTVAPDAIDAATAARVRDGGCDSAEEAEAAAHACMTLCDELCAIAAEGLRGEAEAFTAVRQLLDDGQPAGAELFAKHLDLAPLGRRAVSMLPDWFGRMNSDKAAAVRLAYKDAVNIADDAGPRLFEILYANCAQPWLILRLLSAVMGHPGERYLAVSELAVFGQRILEDIDRHLAAFQALDPNKGKTEGLAAGDHIRTAAMEITEFEDSVELNRQDGVWGRRLVKQKQRMAELAEARLGQIEKALDAALPLQKVKFGKGVRAQPRLDVEPDLDALRRAESLMAFFDYSRQFASTSGYGAARAKAAEKIEGRLDQYVEDLLEMLRSEDRSDLDRVRTYLAIAADMMDAARGEKAGQIVRRRAAA